MSQSSWKGALLIKAYLYPFCFGFCCLLINFYSTAAHAQTLEKQRAVLQWGEAQSMQGYRLFIEGRFAEALVLEQNLLRIRMEQLGPLHSETARSYHCIGRLQLAMGNYGEAEKLFLKALEITIQADGKTHANTAHVLNGLAVLYTTTGEYEYSQTLHEKSLRIRTILFGENDPDTIESLNNLASLHHLVGNLPKAEELFRKCLQAIRRLKSIENWKVATALNNIADFHRSQGDVARAENLFKESLKIRRAIFPQGHPDIASTLNNIALLYLDMGQPDYAEALLQESLNMVLDWFDIESPQVTTTMGNLATFYTVRRKLEKAEPLLLASLKAHQKIWGEVHPATARILNSLGLLQTLKGNFESAEKLARRSLTDRRKILGEEHLDTINSLLNLGYLYSLAGKPHQGEPLLRKGLNHLRRYLESASISQSERQQLLAVANLRLNLDVWLVLAPPAGVSSAEQASELLVWKGAVATSQTYSRLDLQSAEAKRVHRELTYASVRLATLAQQAPPNGKAFKDWQRRLRELTDRREQLERDLAKVGAEFRRPLAPVSSEVFRQTLPPRTALVDFIIYHYFEPPKDLSKLRHGLATERRLAGFIMRPDRPVVRVEFGPIEPIETTIEAWRESFRPEHGQRLRRLLITPLQQHIQSIDRLLVSPDGRLSRLPWTAIPGKAPGKYLIEDLAVAVIPVPQLLPDLLANETDFQSSTLATSNILLLGNVDYGGSPGKSRPPALKRAVNPWAQAQDKRFPPLDYTGLEIAQIGSLFQKRFSHIQPTWMTSQNATEDKFRQQAPRHRWLHLATHGFFAPVETASVLMPLDRSMMGTLFERDGVVSFHPGLLSGLALTGGNTVPGPDDDDGLLTALEVAALDLRRVDMVVLSACETGLGFPASGEGVLGLQRAFQISGGRTTVTSLWSVGDLATQQLMERFYRNLWLEGKGKLEALREAQLWLLQGQREHSKVRGSEPQSLAEENLMSPRDWAGFVLSGDWR